MLADAVKIAIKFIIKNQAFEFDQRLYRRTKGGPIGLEIADDIANTFIAWWDKQLLQKLHEDQKQVVLYKRYIYDINLAIKTATEN